MSNISKRRLIFLFDVFAVVISLCGVFFMLKSDNPLTPYEQAGQLLSELPEVECKEFVLSKGVQIPSSLNSGHIDGFIKELICQAEREPQVQCGYFSSTDTVYLAESIRKVVNEYYGVDGCYVYNK